MTHEFKNIVQSYLEAEKKGLSCAVATVVALDGSSYRRPGVRMLIIENGKMVGAVSGGCVEKEILKQSHSVFESNLPKMITYDGRYRLGCEGTLYIMIERFAPGPGFLDAFKALLKSRSAFEIKSEFVRQVGAEQGIGSSLVGSDGSEYPFYVHDEGSTSSLNKEKEMFIQQMKPCFKLVIIGTEHDAAQLSMLASGLGWEVNVVGSPSSPHVLPDFPGAVALLKKNAEELDLSFFDANTAVVLMTHSYVRDLQYFLRLKDTRPAYIGLLGPSNRRERLFNDLIEKFPDIDEGLFDIVFGPAGLNIGAETPQEIALSICAEILSVTRGQEPKSLKDKTGRIHLGISL